MNTGIHMRVHLQVKLTCKFDLECTCDWVGVHLQGPQSLAHCVAMLRFFLEFFLRSFVNFDPVGQKGQRKTSAKVRENLYADKAMTTF